MTQTSSRDRRDRRGFILIVVLALVGLGCVTVAVRVLGSNSTALEAVSTVGPNSSVIVPQSSEEALDLVSLAPLEEGTITYRMVSRAAVSVEYPLQEALWEFRLTDGWEAWLLKTIDDRGGSMGYCEFYPDGGVFADEGCVASPAPAPGPHLNPGALQLALGLAGTEGLRAPTVSEAEIVALAERLEVEEVIAFSVRDQVDCGDDGYNCAAFGVSKDDLADVENHVFDTYTGIQLYWDRSIGEHLLSMREVLSADLSTVQAPS